MEEVPEEMRKHGLEGGAWLWKKEGKGGSRWHHHSPLPHAPYLYFRYCCFAVIIVSVPRPCLGKVGATSGYLSKVCEDPHVGDFHIREYGANGSKDWSLGPFAAMPIHSKYQLRNGLDLPSVLSSAPVSPAAGLPGVKSGGPGSVPNLSCNYKQVSLHLSLSFLY